MSIEAPTYQLALFSIDSLWFLIKIGLIIFATIYFLFSIIVVRQVNLMTQTLITEVAPLLRALAIVFAGLSLGVIILFIGLLFG